LVTRAEDELETPALTDRIDLRLICDLVKPGSSVLDLGCGDGDLMALLIRERRVTARGVEISEDGVYHCIARGLSVHHGDLDEGLEDYPDNAFDYVILSQTLQAVHKPKLALQEMLRVGRVGIVSFPNFAFWQSRLHLAIQGRMPKTNDLPYEWYNTPNIHLTTIRDFLELCEAEGMEVADKLFLSGKRRVKLIPNLRARMALFMVRKKR
jgi:methionine biosynthesis protein MetW